MRVLHILPSVASVQGGPARSTCATIRAVHLADPGVGGTLLSTDHKLTADWRRWLEGQFPDNVDLRTFHFYGWHTLSFAPGLLGWLRHHVRTYDLVVVRTLLHPISTASAAIARRAGVPYVLTPHGTLSNYTFAHRNTRLKEIYYKHIETRTLAGSAGVQCTTQHEADELLERGCPARVVVIPHPFEGEQAAEDFGASSSDRDPNLVLFLSRLDPMKGFDVLLPAFAQVRMQVPDARLVIAGSGNPGYERSLRQEVERLELTNAVTFVGFVDGEAKATLLRQAAVFVLPSLRENFGIAVVEAMAAGVPVVICREVDISKEVEAFSAGRVVQRTPGAFAEALVALLGDQSTARAMGARGHSLVQDAFAPEVVGPRLLAFYREAAVQRRPAAVALAPA